MQDLEGLLTHIGCSKLIEREGSSSDLYGSKIICTCPLHEDSSPSFMLRTEAPYYWNCFVCGKGAGLEKLVMRAMQVEYSEALKIVNEYVDLGTHYLRKKLSGPRELTPLPETHLAAYDGKYRFLATWYMIHRGFLRHVLEEHQIGYDWRQKRVTVPIRSPDGDLLAIMGRSITRKGQRQLVYGERGKETLLLGCHDIDDTGDIYVVEGQFDYLKLKQYGCRNVVALLNSKITDYQLELLLSYNRKLRLFLDNDKAGANGAVYIINKVKGKVPVAVPCYEEGDTDPCELTIERFKELDAGAESPWKRRINKFD